MRNKRLFRLVSLLALIALVLAGCQKPCLDCEDLEAQGLPYLRIDKALVRHEMTNLGFLTIGDGEPDTEQVEASESLYVDGWAEINGVAYLDAIVVDLTSDLQGNVWDSLGAFTIADNVVITSTTDFQDDIADSVGDLTIADDTVITGTLNVQDAVDFDSTLDMSAQVVSNVGNAGTDFTSTGGLILAGNLAVSPGVANTAVISTTAITPLTSSVVITASSTITTATMAACTVNGQLVVIAIAGSNDITITESSTLYAGGSIVLDASEFDAVILMCVETKWRKIAAFADN